MLLVTGITGHTGRYFYDELVNNNYDGIVRCLVRSTSNTSLLDNSTLNIEIVRGDINNENTIEEAMKGVEEVVHIYNIHNSVSIIKAAIKYQVKKVVLVHTTGIYSNYKEASTRYIEIEKELNNILKANRNINIIILRPSMIYGDLCDHNMSKFIKVIDKLKFMPVINEGESLIQPVNARDLGKAYFTALTSIYGQKAYDLTGDRPISLKEAYQIIASNLNKKLYFIKIPLWLGVTIARVVKIGTLGKVDLVEKIQRMAENRSYSHAKAIQDFDYSPLTFEEGISIEVQQYLERSRGTIN